MIGFELFFGNFIKQNGGFFIDINIRFAFLSLGVSRQTINALETGKYDPSLPLAFKLAKLFNQRIEEIFLEETTA